MKRVVMLLAAGALILGSALPAKAQAPTVSFGGQMRVYGFAFNNMTDFTDTKGTASKDSASFFWQRFRLFTTIESADKKAKAYWALEIGDITWGNGGGASGGEFAVGNASPACQTAAGATCSGGGSRVGNGSGGGFGADGINVETKNIYLWFQVPGVEGASLLLGIHNTVFLATPVGAVMDDDAAGIQFNWKGDPIDLQVYMAKVSENSIFNADDNDMYVARLGVNVTKDTRVTLEGMLINTQCLARRAAPVSTCVSADIGDNFWIGATAATKIGTISLDGLFVYGQRQNFCPTCGDKATAEEKGWGVMALARMPVGPLNMNFQGWYTTGDESRPISPGGNGTGSTAANATLTKSSDKLPIPISGAAFQGAPFIAEWLTGQGSIGGPGWSQAGSSLQYADLTGTYGIGASALYALTPQVTVGGGVAYVGVTETPGAGLTQGVYGDNVFTLDAGIFYQFNANLSIRPMVGYMIPDKGDNAWGLVFRTQYAF